jgi:tetratricopeptide (TPR) repeat protein
MIINIVFLKVFNLNTILAGVITVTLIFLGYIIYANTRQKKRHDLLEKYLDPDAFIKATEKQLKITGKNKQANTMLNLDLLLGFLCMRNYEEAKDALNNINKKYLTKWNGSILIFHSYEMNLYYNTGEIDKAMKIYETRIKEYPIKILNESITMNLILANKSYNEKEYKISRELYQRVLQGNKSKRLEIEIYYILANIDEDEGNIEEAIKKYKKVVNEGNKLYSVNLAKEKLKVLLP